MDSSVKIPSSLEADSAITRLDAKTYSAELRPAFCIGTVPNGGYVATVMLKVAEAHLASRGQKDTIAAHWQYLGRTQAGRAILVVEETKLGRSNSVLHISLHQDGFLPQQPWVKEGSRREVTAYITNGNIDAEAGITLPTRWALNHTPPPVDLVKLADDNDAHWERFFARLMKRVRAMQNLEFYRRRTGHVLPTTQDLWIRMASGDRFTQTSLAYVIDATPALLVEEFRPATSDSPVPEGGFASSKSFWYPTLTMNLEVKKRLPSVGEEWLRLRVVAKAVQNGRLDVEVNVFDALGDLVALSHQVAMAVDIERNHAGRQQTKGKI